MKIQSSNALIGYFNTNKKNGAEEEKGVFGLLLGEDEKKEKEEAKFEIRIENGYVRKYIVKPNGRRVLIMQTKQTQEDLTENKSGNLVDIAYEKLMKQLDTLRKAQENGESVIAMTEKQKQENISKYKRGI